jgi:hypothetical protein
MKPTLFVLAVLLFAGCKKNGTPAPSCSNLVRAVTSHSSIPGSDTIPITTTYTYDAQNRIIQQTGPYVSYTYTYTSNTVNKMFYQSGSLNSTTTGYLNAQGLLFSWAPGDTIYYDSLGEEVLEVSPGDTFVVTWQNGDIITQASHSLHGLYVDTFFYSTAIDNRNLGQPYLGKQSTHVSTAIHIYNDGLMPIWGASNYTFDACNRVNVAQNINLNIARDTSFVAFTYY